MLIKKKGRGGYLQAIANTGRLERTRKDKTSVLGSYCVLGVKIRGVCNCIGNLSRYRTMLNILNHIDGKLSLRPFE